MYVGVVGAGGAWMSVGVVDAGGAWMYVGVVGAGGAWISVGVVGAGGTWMSVRDPVWPEAWVSLMYGSNCIVCVFMWCWRYPGYLLCDSICTLDV